jgi:hypothetical protein
MRLTYLFKWGNSGGGGCPAVYDTDDGNLVIQGYTLADSDAGQMRNVAANEAGVKIPYEMAEQIADMVIARRNA